MDGVLLDSETVWDCVWKQYSTVLGLDHVDEACNACRGCNAADQIEILKKIYGSQFDAKKFFEGALELFYESERKNGIPKKPYAAEILAYLKQKDYMLALASSTGRIAVERQLKRVGLLDFFDKTICGDEVKHSKPAPDIYLIACNAIGVPPQNCVAVEDSPNGIRSAFAAGMNCVMVPDKIACDQEIAKLLWKKCDSLEDLKKFL
jgi:HAD superfamily hydrolase (TIGR01509 family)